MIDINDIFNEIKMFFREYPEIFNKGSWTPALTSCLYILGHKMQLEVRCGDYSKKIKKILEKNRINKPKYEQMTKEWTNKNGWKVHGLLDIDLCWVTQCFTIPKDFSELPRPKNDESKIFLAFEYEDEGTLYTDKKGTNLNVILDEIRKFGNVKTNYKFLSYITSKTEIADNNEHIQKIKNEISLIPNHEILTDKWIILQIAKYQKKNSKKKPIIVNEKRILYLQYIVLSGNELNTTFLREEIEYPI